MARDPNTEDDAPLDGGDRTTRLVLPGFAVLILLNGLAILATAWLPESELRRFFALGGVDVPVLTEVALQVRPLGPVIGLCGAAAVVALSRTRWRVRAWAVAVGLFLASLGVGALGLSLTLPVVTRLGWVAGGDSPQPGRSAEVAQAAIETFRDALARGEGTLRTPAGRTRHYVLCDVPGADLPEADGALPPYEEARRHPGCLLLPWGEDGNTERRSEPLLVFPSGEPEGVTPEAIDGYRPGADDPPPWAVEIANFVERPSGARSMAYPAAVEVRRPEGGYAYSLVVQRARLDTAPGSVASHGRGAGPDAPPLRLDDDDAFSDGLLQVTVRVFRGFDPDAAGQSPMPRNNVPVLSFATLVAR